MVVIQFLLDVLPLSCVVTEKFSVYDTYALAALFLVVMIKYESVVG